MRKHIAQALKKRSNAVKSALTAYNNAARNLVPPRPTYEWEALSHYGFLQDCILLRESSPDILSKRWSQPAIRVLMKQHLRVRRAREEIVRCNIEIRRLHTFIVDENSSLQKTLGGLQDSGDIWFGPFQEYCMFRRRVNDCILARIAQTYQLAGFTGIPKPGVKKGKATSPDLPTAPVPELDSEIVEVEVDNALGASTVDDDDGIMDQMNNLIEYTGNLSLH